MAGKPQVDFWSRVTVNGSIAKIALPCGRAAIIDSEDLVKCSPYVWNSAKRGKRCYAVGRLQSAAVRKLIYLHRLILGEPSSTLVDHKDFDGLNCLKLNLRRCNPKQNVAHRRWIVGRAGFRGVTFHKKAGKYVAHVQSRHVGIYATAEEAARARDAEAIRVFGEFALLNFPAKEGVSCR